MFLFFVSGDLPQPEEQEDTDRCRQENEQDALPATSVTQKTEGSALVSCVNDALQSLDGAGTLDALAEQWLQGGGDIPNISE